MMIVMRMMIIVILIIVIIIMVIEVVRIRVSIGGFVLPCIEDTITSE